MTERSEPKYSVGEIRALRYWVTRLHEVEHDSECYKPDERTAEIESELQTYMLNGTTADELEKEYYVALEETDDD